MTAAVCTACPGARAVAFLGPEAEEYEQSPLELDEGRCFDPSEHRSSVGPGPVGSVSRGSRGGCPGLCAVLPASAVRWLVVPVVATRRGRLGWWSRPRTGLWGLFFMPTVTPVSVNAVAVLCLVGADVRAWCPRRWSGGQPGAGWPRGPGRGSGRLWVGVVCLLPARALRVKGRGVWMDNGVVSWPWRRVAAQSQRFCVLRGPQRAGTARCQPRSMGWPRASQAEAAANAFGTSAVHPCPNQADPLWA